MSQPPTPALAPPKTTCQRGQSGPRVQYSQVGSGQVSSLSSCAQKKSSRVFLFFSDFSMLFPFESFPCGLCTRFKHMAAVQPDQTHFCTLHSLKVLRFFRYFGNLRVPSRVNTIITMYAVQYKVHYLTHDDKCIMYVAQEKRIPLETRQTIASFHFSFT